MSIKPPHYQQDAVITTRGWMHPYRNELLVSRKFTQFEVDEYLGNEEVAEESKNKKVKEVVEKVVDKTDTVLLTEAPIAQKSLQDMTKEEKEALDETLTLENETDTEALTE